jgi:hypothetical protein
MHPDDLQRWLDAELKRLPAPRAPRTLLPRVLAATVARGPKPWYERPWLSWPMAARVASAAAAILLAAAAGFYVLPLVGNWQAGAAGGAEPGRVAAMLDTLGRASSLVRVSWRLLLEPVAFALMVAAVILSLGCAAFWALLEVALGGASES